MAEPDVRVTEKVLGIPVDVVTWDQALVRIQRMSDARRGGYVCLTNVHSIVTANRESSFRKATADADLVTPDGAPVAWMLRRLGYSQQVRINGPDLMLKYLATAEMKGEAIYLYGSAPRTLARLTKMLEERFPNLRVAGACSPPFRTLTSEEDQAVVREIGASGARTVWVSLGCPKQELWMAAHRSQIHAVMVGVGAAFDYHAGTVKRAPIWMQRNGLEWFHRLVVEPRRLAKRYLVTNAIFLAGAVAQLLSRLRQQRTR